MHLSLDCGHNFATIFVNVHIRSKQGNLRCQRREISTKRNFTRILFGFSGLWYQWYVNKSFQEDRESFDFHFHLFFWWSQSTRGVFSWNYVDILLIWWWFSQKGKHFIYEVFKVFKPSFILSLSSQHRTYGLCLCWKWKRHVCLYIFIIFVGWTKGKSWTSKVGAFLNYIYLCSCDNLWRKIFHIVKNCRMWVIVIARPCLKTQDGHPFVFLRFLSFIPLT